MTKRTAFLLAATLVATPLFAQTALVDIYSAHLAQCYAQTDGPAAQTKCIGALSTACIAEEEGGGTTLGISMCNNAEVEYWDILLNEEYRLTMDWAKSFDQEGKAYIPEFTNRAKSLRAAQRAWIIFRDAECELDYAVWGASSMRHIAGTDCIKNLTARRTIELRQKREFFE